MRYSATEEELLQSRASSHNSPTQGKLEAYIVLVENSLRQFRSITSRILTAHNLTRDYRAHITKMGFIVGAHQRGKSSFSCKRAW